MAKTGILLLFACLSLSSFAQRKISTNQIDWVQFLSQHDMIWDEIKPDYYSGAIMGNGLLGVNFYKDKDSCSYRWDIGRSDVTEHRGGTEALFNEARLPIGCFKLIPTGKVRSESMRLSLWDATTEGILGTDKGNVCFKTYVDANREIIVIDTKTEGARMNLQWAWSPDVAISPRTSFAYTRASVPQNYLDKPNPHVEILAEGDFHYSIQKLLSGWVYITAWHRYDIGEIQRTLVTVSYKKNTHAAMEEARSLLETYKKEADEAREQHLHWWHKYYPASYVTFPDAKLESFYWRQQYKLACLTRPDKSIIDLQGPWTNLTPWPAIWWNLNVQLTYSSLFTANRTELSEPLWKALDDYKQSLINNVDVKEWRKDASALGRSSSYNLVSPLRSDLASVNQYEVGNLTWVLFYYWQYCTYCADEKELLEKFYPLLKRSIAYYLHLLQQGEDGKMHLPLTASPEYKPAVDCNFDLSLLRWGLTTLLSINKEYRLKDTLQNSWKSTLANLTDYPADREEGYTIGRGVKLESSHRHYSHLLMIYPLHLVSWEQPENRNIIQRSLNHWIGMKGALQGYSYTGSSSIYSLMGNGEMAVRQLNELLERYIQPNTLYKESGPVVETPLAAACSMQELYLQSWGRKICLFPAVPAAWKDLSFINFRAEGAFLVSAVREKGCTVSVQIESEAGGICAIQTGLDIDKITISTIKGDQKYKYKVLDRQTGLIELFIRRGDIIQIKDR